MQSLAVKLSGGLCVNSEKIMTLLKDAFYENDVKFTEARALQWAGGFKFPAEVYSKDLSDLMGVNGDLEELGRLRQDISRDTRLNINRVNDLQINDLTWKDRLIKMASGIPILTAPGFIPTNIPPKLRRKYERLAPAINKSIFELYKKI